MKITDISDTYIISPSKVSVIKSVKFARLGTPIHGMYYDRDLFYIDCVIDSVEITLYYESSYEADSTYYKLLECINENN